MLRKFAAALVAFMLVAGAAQADTVEIRVATFVPEQSVGVSRVIKPWMDAVQAELGDQVKLQGHWGGSLGKNPFKQYELVKNGVADVTWVLPGYTAGQFPELQAFELPYLAEIAYEASIAGWKLHEQGLLTGFDDVHLIGFFASAPSVVFTREPMSGLDDLKNRKIRSVGPVHARWVESVGASPETMASTKMNEALNRGVLDGLIQGWIGLRTFKTIPLVTHVYEAPIGVIPFVLLMNKKKWESLSPDVQAAIMKHGGLAIAEAGGRAYDDIAVEIRESIVAGGQHTFVPISDAERAAATADAKAIHDWWAGKAANGGAVYAALVEHLNEARAGM